MKKKAVYSFFDSYNIGDILISEQVEKLFAHHNCDFFNIGDGRPKSNEGGLKRDYSANEKKTFKRLLLNTPMIKDIIGFVYALKSSKHKDICRSSQNADKVIFAGGNQIMELNRLPSNIIVFYRAIKMLKKQGKKIYFLFCGIGPFFSPVSKLYAKKILQFANFISVRDGFSAYWAEKLIPHKGYELWCDPVLLMQGKGIVAEKKAIGINVYFGHEKKHKKRMKAAFLRVIGQIRKQEKQMPIYLFSSELTDISDINEIKEHFIHDKNVIVKKVESPDSLFKLYRETMAVLGTRMHTVITATISRVPVLSIAWQGKVEAVMELLENGERNYSVNDFVTCPEKVAKNLILAARDFEKTEKVSIRLNEIKQKTELSFNKFLLELEN